MLKKIPDVISPDLMKILMEMGHGDEIVIADGNFPSYKFGVKVVRADGHGVPKILKAILEFFPLDTYSESNVILMDNGSEEKPSIWKKYEEILKESGEPFSMKTLERFEFYERASKAFCIVATSETSLYANVILKKGVIV